MEHLTGDAADLYHHCKRDTRVATSVRDYARHHRTDNTAPMDEARRDIDDATRQWVIDERTGKHVLSPSIPESVVLRVARMMERT